MRRSYVIILSVLVLLAMVAVYLSYRLDQRDQPPSSTLPLTNSGELVECYTDADCMPAGCSGTLCVARLQSDSTVTTCEYQEAYSCFAEDNCLCQHNRCAWEGNEQFRTCVETLQGDPCVGLEGEQLSLCERDRGNNIRCRGQVGMDYVNCLTAQTVNLNTAE
ncbi:MAG: eight-cysteine-cluster domain-containing protein [Patescibacteria group bacterium]